MGIGEDIFWEVLDEFDRRITPLDKALAEAAEQSPEARPLMTQPGVGPVVSLAYVLVIGDWMQFPRGKQGNTILRWLLVEAAIKAQRFDPSWHRQYLRLSINKHHGVAKVAITHKLAVRLYWMLRSGKNYEQIREHSSHAGQSAIPRGSVLRPTI
jgi:transposase